MMTSLIESLAVHQDGSKWDDTAEVVNVHLRVHVCHVVLCGGWGNVHEDVLAIQVLSPPAK